MTKRKNLAELPVEQNTLPMPSRNSVETILQRGKEAIAIWGGLVGSIIAILWVTGRTYARGYFEDAMGIPLYHIDLSIWEYVEVAWGLLLLWGIILLIVGYGIFNIWRRINTSKNLFRLGFLLGVLILIFVVLNTFFDWVGRLGVETGRDVVLGKGFQVDFTSDLPQPLGTPVIISTTVGTQIDSQYVYQGFRLLTFNGGYYYVFQQIDPQTCRPENVKVVDRKRVAQVQFTTSTSLRTMCSIVK